MREMPKLNPRTLDPPHHTAAVDWDHRYDVWSLDDTVYVSEPKSLKWPQSTVAGEERVSLCKHEGTTALNQGRVVTQLRHNSIYGFNMVFFRNQAAVGTATITNTYWVSFVSQYTSVYFFKSVGGTYTLIASKPYGGGFTYPAGVWRKIRVTWWETGGVLYVRLEWWNDSEWVNICDDVYDPDNLWSGSAVNRCGVGAGVTSVGAYICWFDDTEIWGP